LERSWICLGTNKLKFEINDLNWRMNKKIIFCLSNLNIPSTISLATNEFEIFTQSKDIYNFLKLMYPDKYLKYIEESDIADKSLIYKGCLFFKSKFNLRKKFEKYKNCDVYFFLVSYAHEMAYAIRILSKKNQIYHQPAVRLPQLEVCQKSFLWRFFLKLFYGLDIDSFKIGDRLIYLYSPSFFQKINAKPAYISIDASSISAQTSKVLNNYSEKIVFFMTDRLDEKFIKELYKILNLILNSVGPNHIAIKYRNSLQEEFKFDLIYRTLPNFFPGNIMIANFSIVVAIDSAILFEAANMGIKSISLINLFSTLSNTIKTDFISYAQSNLNHNATIYYPYTVEEFLELIC